MIASQKLVLEPELCRDCQACTLACSLYHDRQCHLGLARLRVLKDMTHYEFQVVVCRECEDAECLGACPNEAIRLDDRGVVTVYHDECLLCGACAAACPYQAIFYDASGDRYLKCDLCAGRDDGPVCVAVCPVGAIRTARPDAPA